MAEQYVTVTGYVSADPELKRTSTGLAVINLNIGFTPSRYNKETSQWDNLETIWYRATAWRDFAENIATTISKGDKIVAYGKLIQETYETTTGEKRVNLKLELEALGQDLNTKVKTNVATPASSAVSSWTTMNPATSDDWADSPTF